MVRKIAVQRNLKSIRDKVAREGYHVVDLENTGEIIDAAIYSSSRPDEEGSHAHHLGPGSNSAFVLMINADENTEEEIISFLEDL